MTVPEGASAQVVLPDHPEQLTSEFRVESPIGVAFAMPFLDPNDAFALEPLLRGIHI